MARKERTDYRGAWHHVGNGGLRDLPIFADAADMSMFLDTVRETADQFGLEFHGLSLVPTQYHLLVCSVRGNLSRSMRHLAGTYTQRFNRKHGWSGPVFRGRFRSQVIPEDELLPPLLAWIHLFPVKEKLIGRVTQSHDQCWTTHRAYVGTDEPPEWLYCDDLLELAGGPGELGKLVTRLKSGAQSWPEGMNPQTGWLTGAAARDQNDGDDGEEELTAQHVLHWVSEVTGATVDEIREVRRGPRANPPRRFAAWAIYRCTNLTHAEVGEQIDMSPAQVANTVARLNRLPPPPPLDQWIADWKAMEVEE